MKDMQLKPNPMSHDEFRPLYTQHTVHCRHISIICLKLEYKKSLIYDRLD